MRSTHPLDTRTKVHLFLPLAIFLHSSGKGAWSAPRGRRRVRTRATWHNPRRRRFLRSASCAFDRRPRAWSTQHFSNRMTEGLCSSRARIEAHARERDITLAAGKIFTRRRHTQAPPRAPTSPSFDTLSGKASRGAAAPCTNKDACAGANLFSTPWSSSPRGGASRPPHASKHLLLLLMRHKRNAELGEQPCANRGACTGATPLHARGQRIFLRGRPPLPTPQRAPASTFLLSAL